MKINIILNDGKSYSINDVESVKYTGKTLIIHTNNGDKFISQYEFKTFECITYCAKK